MLSQTILRSIRATASVPVGSAGQLLSRAFSAETPNPPAEASKPAEGAEPAAAADAEQPAPARRRRLTRKERGSYSSHFGQEIEAMPEIPYKGFLYRTRDVVAEEPDFGPFARVIENPDVLKEFMPLAEEAEKAMEDLPYPGAKPILNWTTRYILQAGDDQYHPLNSKVECTVRMSDLQSEYGLSKEAIDFIKEVCGPRYNKTSGVLRLVSTKYRDREDNRREVMRIIAELVQAGHEEAQRQATEGGGGAAPAKKAGSGSQAVPP